MKSAILAAMIPTMSSSIFSPMYGVTYRAMPWAMCRAMFISCPVQFTVYCLLLTILAVCRIVFVFFLGVQNSEFPDPVCFLLYAVYFLSSPLSSGFSPHLSLWLSCELLLWLPGGLCLLALLLTMRSTDSHRLAQISRPCLSVL